VFIKQCIYVI